MALDQLREPVLLEGQRDELEERIPEDRDDRDDDRRNEEVRDGAAAERLEGEGAPPDGGERRRFDDGRGAVRGGIRCHR